MVLWTLKGFQKQSSTLHSEAAIENLMYLPLLQPSLRSGCCWPGTNSLQAQGEPRNYEMVELCHKSEQRFRFGSWHGEVVFWTCGKAPVWAGQRSKLCKSAIGCMGGYILLLRSLPPSDAQLRPGVRLCFKARCKRWSPNIIEGDDKDCLKIGKAEVVKLHGHFHVDHSVSTVPGGRQQLSLT